jgi:hypothetical protein
MIIAGVFLALLLQVPAPGQRIVVGLDDGQDLTVLDPVFSGFIEGRSGDAVLIYRQGRLHGELSLKTVARIEFGPYKRGKPFPMSVTLRNGQTLLVESERRDFVMVRGKTDFGTVTIRHPDPISSPLKITSRKPDRSKDLTIHYLEFTAP